MSKREVEEAHEVFFLHMSIRNRAGKYLKEDYLYFHFLGRVIQSIVEHLEGTMNAKITYSVAFATQREAHDMNL